MTNRLLAALAWRILLLTALCTIASFILAAQIPLPRSWTPFERTWPWSVTFWIISGERLGEWLHRRTTKEEDQ